MNKTKFSVKTANPLLYEILKENAYKMRNNPTEAESVAWILLKDVDAKFRRQHIIGDFIVDFINLETGLILEIDGGYHNDLQQKEEDEKRTQVLTDLGYTVIRFNNEEVIFKPDYFIETVKTIINSLRIPPL